MKQLAESLLKMAEECSPELSKGAMRLDHKDVLELLATCAQIEVQQKILRELQFLSQEKRIRMNQASLLSPLMGSTLEKDDD